MEMEMEMKGKQSDGFGFGRRKKRRKKCNNNKNYRLVSRSSNRTKVPRLEKGVRNKNIGKSLLHAS